MSEDPFIDLMTRLDSLLARGADDELFEDRGAEFELWQRLSSALRAKALSLDDPRRNLDCLAECFQFQRWACFRRRGESQIEAIAASDVEAGDRLFESYLAKVFESEASFAHGDGPCTLLIAIAPAKVPPKSSERREGSATRRLRAVLAIQSERPFNALERTALDSLAALAFDHWELTQRLRQSTQDPGTGLESRASLSRDLSELNQSFQFDRRPLSLITLGLQRLEGEAPRSERTAEQHLASRLRRALREGDRVFRYSPRAFAVLLPETDARGAEVVCRRLLKESRASLQERSQEIWRIAASWASCPDHCSAPTELLRVADRALGLAWSRSEELQAPSELAADASLEFDGLAILLSGHFVPDHELLTQLERSRAELCAPDLAAAAPRVLAEFRALLKLDSLALIDQRNRVAVLACDAGERAEMRAASDWERLLARLPLEGAARRTTLQDLGRTMTDSFSRFNLRSLFLSPVHYGARRLGSLIAEGHGLTPEDSEAILPLLVRLGEPFGSALEIDRLRQEVARLQT